MEKSKDPIEQLVIYNIKSEVRFGIFTLQGQTRTWPFLTDRYEDPFWIWYENNQTFKTRICILSEFTSTKMRSL